MHTTTSDFEPVATKDVPANSPVAARERRVLWAASLLFVLSGLAALIYQIAWQRILALHTGVGIYSVALIVSAFMAGLGLGSHLGGLLSRRLERLQALRAFAVVELSVGIFAAFSTWLYYDLLYARAAWLYSVTWRAGLLHFAALLPATLLMGMSLPLLARALVRDGATSARTLGWLYGFNVAGAALGAWLAPWVLIRHFGVRGAVLFGAAASVAAGLSALRLGRLVPRDAVATPAPEPAGMRLEERGSWRLWLTLYTLSGFCALALEVLWFRLLDVAVKSTAFTFGTLLAIYLTGSAAGALMGARVSARIRRPLRTFLLCQCALLLCTGIAFIALVKLPVGTPGYGWFVTYWAQTDGYRLGRVFAADVLLRLYVLLPLALFGVPTLLMGFAFPIVQRAVHDDARTAGFKVGLLQAANILGCVLGSLAVGLLALDHLGTAGALRAIVALGLVFALLGVWTQRTNKRPFVLATAALLVTLALFPRDQELWLRLHGIAPAASSEVLIGEDATGVVALAQRSSGTWDLTINGLWNSTLPFSGIHAVLGAMPVLMHPRPNDVAVVGLGTGTTAWAALCRGETRAARVYEICWPQLGLLQDLAERPGRPVHLRRFLNDPRLDVRFADGRHALHSAATLYDTIEMDALRPTHAMAGNLYSLEFFQAAAQRLKPGGLMCSWAPTPRVHATFLQAFPYVLELGSETVLVGSREPIPVEPEVWLARLHTREVFAYLGLEVAEPLADLIKRTRPAPREPITERDLNHDLFPRDELGSPR